MVIIIRLLLLLLPLIGVIYFLRWRHRHKVSGEAPNDEDIKKVRMILIVTLVSILMFGFYLRLTETSSDDRDAIYIPPHMEDGEIVPGEFKKKDEAVKPKEKPKTQDNE